MLKVKLMLVTVLVAALAVPSLWGQKEDTLARRSIKQIKAELQARATALNVPAVCQLVITGNIPPGGYFSGTNKCSSSNANYGNGQSINSFVGTCADKGGVEGTWGPFGRTVEDPAGTSGSPFTFWGNGFAAGSVEIQNPDVYGDSTNIATDTTLTLKSKQSVLGLEFSNSDPTVQLYTVTVHTSTAGDLVVPGVRVGGSSMELDPGAQRPVAICNARVITGIDLSCTSCSELSGDGKTGVAQIRAAEFPGF
jgi:hypothetical protein